MASLNVLLKINRSYSHQGHSLCEIRKLNSKKDNERKLIDTGVTSVTLTFDLKTNRGHLLNKVFHYVKKESSVMNIC